MFINISDRIINQYLMQQPKDNIIAQGIKQIKLPELQPQRERSQQQLDRIERQRQQSINRSRLRRRNQQILQQQRQAQQRQAQQRQADRLRVQQQQQQQRLNARQMNGQQDIKDRISAFLQNDKKSLIDEVQELKIQLKKKYLSQKAIQQEKKRIAAKIFYFPTVGLVNAIKANGKDHQVVLFKSIALKHGDLQQYANNFGAQIKHITQNVVNWGSLYFDIKKLEQSATRKTGGMSKKTYQLEPYELEVALTPKQSNSITVKYKGSVTSQHEFKEIHLEKIAEQRLRQIATRMYYDFIKNDKFM